MEKTSEIELLERVFLRLGCAETDDQLQAAITKFLLPVLEKIESNQEAVRMKVMEILTHINKRLKTRPMIQVPMVEILQYYTQTESAFAMNFSIIYITMGFPRLTKEKQIHIVPVLLSSLTGKPETQQDKLLVLIVPLLGTINWTSDEAERKFMEKLAGQSVETNRKLLDIIQDVLLLPYGITQEGEVPPGMSTYTFKRVIANNWKADELEEYKKGLVRFLCRNVFSNEDILVALVVGAADTRFGVVTLALAELSKICSIIDWENPKVTEPLYVLFSGCKSKNKDKTTKAASVRVRQKLLQYLLKCRQKGINEVRGLQVIFESLFGEQTNQKCKITSLQFCGNLIREGEKQMVNRLAKILFDGINKLLQANEPFEVHNAAYLALSQLIQKCPDVVLLDLQMISTYFKKLIQAPAEQQESIKDVLQAMAPAFAGKDRVTETLLLALLADFASTLSAIVKRVLVVYLITCFPKQCIPAKYLLLLLLDGEDKSSVKELIMLNLYGATKRDNIDLTKLLAPDDVFERMDDDGDHQHYVLVPKFSDMARYCHDEAMKRKNKFGIASHDLVFTVEVHTEMLYYLQVCLWKSAGLRVAPVGECIQLKKYIVKTARDGDGIQKYVAFIKELLVFHKKFVPLSCLFDVFNSGLQPTEIKEFGGDLMQLLENGLNDVTEGLRTIIAQLYGILLANISPNDTDFENQINKLINDSAAKTLEQRNGSYLATAFAIRQRILVTGAVPIKCLEAVTLELVTALNEQHPLIVSSAVRGIAWLSQLSKLPLSNAQTMEVDNNVEHVVSKDELLKLLLKLLTMNSTKQKIKEDVCDCIASLTMKDRDYFVKPVLEHILKLNKFTKDAALHIALGQAIVKIVMGVSDTWDLFDDDGRMTHESFDLNCIDKATLDWLVLELVRMVNSEMHPNSRQAVSIWLLGLVRSCHRSTVIAERHVLLQLAFTELLSENNELVQDVASRGLGELYTVTSESDQVAMANSLLDQLSGKTPVVLKVTEETKVFEEGVLGKTPTGENISTYKELCNLASDLNQPDLIYQFMQLANHNAAWNNKLGAAFGLKSIARQAKVDMAPYLGKIVPRLYRYKYDPTPKIQHSMSAIWDSLVVNKKETIELHYWAILEELNKNLTSPEWRTRMSCCLGARDLLKLGVRARHATDSTNDTVEMELLELWKQIFRVMDDIHEGTRLAAEGTANVLSKAFIVACSADHGKTGQRIARTVLPFLLENGITNVVPEVRRISISTVSEMIDETGTTILPHLSQLIPCLLQATGELEGNKMSYLSTRYSAQNDIQDAVDSIRAEAAKQQNTMQTLSKCIRFIDYPALEQMTPHILDLMRSSVNLGTKVACAQFICLISIRLGMDMQPLAGKYITACVNRLSDRNLTVQKSYATSIGHLVGVAKEQNVTKLFQKLQTCYDDRQANKDVIVPSVLQAINKRYPDTLKDNAMLVLPLIFIAMHEEPNETNKQTVELWTDLWNDVSPGEAGIRMNLDAITTLIIKFLDESSWIFKIQAANSIKTLAMKLEKNLAQKERVVLIQKLLTAATGRTFLGKEKLLQALGELCKHYEKNENDADDKLVMCIVDSVMKECRKEEPTYRTHSLKTLGEILNSLHVDRFEEVYNMVWHLLTNRGSSPEASTSANSESHFSDAQDRNKRIVTNIQLKQTVCETLGLAWPDSIETQRKYQLQFIEKCVECVMTNTRAVQLSLMVALGRFLERLKIFEYSNTGGEVHKRMRVELTQPETDQTSDDAALWHICVTILKCVEHISTVPHTGLKKESLNILLILIKKLQENAHWKRYSKLLDDKFQEIVEAFRKDNAPEIKCRLLDIEGKLKL